MLPINETNFPLWIDTVPTGTDYLSINTDSYTVELPQIYQLCYYCTHCGKEMKNLYNESEQPLGGAVLCEECSEYIGGADYYDKEKYKMRVEIIYADD